MDETIPPSPAVVVGIDGSRRAVTAALWAVDEAIDRDVPLRLVYAVEPRERERVDCQTTARDFATAESAVRAAAMAIESTDRPVKIEVEIVQGQATAVLLAASRGAAMVCVGNLGINHATGRRLGSAAAGLLARVHCSVAIITEETRPRNESRCIVTELRDTPDQGLVLRLALDEARRRKAPLRVLTGQRRMFPDVQDSRSAAAGMRQAKARADRSLAHYRRMFPDLDIRAVAVPGDPNAYLERHADEIQLVVVGHDPVDQLSSLGGAVPHAECTELNCSILVCERHGAL
jgi:nucleotide-binding universal stress UspA family protein